MGNTTRLHTFYIGHLYTLLFILLLHLNCAASSDSSGIYNGLRVGGYIKHGTMLPHHGSIAYVLNSNISGAEILVSTQTYGRSPWDGLYRFPRIGMGYNYSTLGNAEVLGSAHAIFGFADIPILRNPAKFNIYYQFTVGLAYLTQHFDIEANPLNLAISSGVNVYGDLKFTARYTTGRRGEVSGGFGFTHFSNGKMGTPNLGLNTFNLSLGYSWLLREPLHAPRIESEIPVVPKHAVDLVLSAGLKTDDNATQSHYLISSLVADYIFYPGPKYAFGGGVDFFYDQALGPNVADKEQIEYKQSDLVQLGVHGGLYARYGRLQVHGHIGTYLLAEFYKYARVYTRIGCRYAITGQLLVGVSLKAHYAIADYIEWGIGYRINP